MSLEALWDLSMDADGGGCYEDDGQFPGIICKMTRLTSLQMNGCRKLHLVPDMFSSLQRLRILSCIVCSGFGTVLEACQSLSQLQELNLCAMEGEYLHLVSNLVSLTHLAFVSMSFKCLPDEIGNLRLLRVLHVRNCFKCVCLPEALSRLSKLEVVDMMTWMIKGWPSVPACVAAMSSVQFIPDI
jgi:hypothetical protein